MEKKLNAVDKLSWYWRNEKNNLELDRYEIDEIFHHIKDIKEENLHLNDEINYYEKEIVKLNDTIDELNDKIRKMEIKYNQLWHEA